MEWDHITDQWAAMTHRLRADAGQIPQNVITSQDRNRPIKQTAVPVPDTSLPKDIGKEPRLLSTS